MPLSALPTTGGLLDGMEVIVPQDYVIAVPWVAFMPEASPNIRGARAVLQMLLSPESKPALSAAGFSYPTGFPGLENLQSELGPELLVFRDMIKRSKFLDIWFQMAIN